MERFWAIGRFNLHLSDAEFGRLTPRQFDLLFERWREERSHQELMHAWTTCAAINFSMGAPEESVEPLRFMPSHREFQRRDAAEDLELQQQLSDFHIRAGIRAIELKNNAKQ